VKPENFNPTSEPWFFRRSHILFGLLMLQSCTTRQAVPDNYRELLRETPQTKQQSPQLESQSERKVLLIIVDGLAVSTLQKGFSQNKVPNLKDFFLKNKKAFSTALATFPTLTYPNLTSLLTGEPVSAHQIYGNTIRFEDQDLNFESPGSTGKLNSLIGPKLYFSKLTENKKKSVSLIHYLYAGATAAIGSDIESGVAYSVHNYDYIDHKTLDALKDLLEETPPNQLPSLIAVHLIGLDAISHRKGPHSSETTDYLAELDQRLEPVFQLVNRIKKTDPNFTTVLTADHGFHKTPKISNLALELKNIQITNQYRYLTLSDSSLNGSLNETSLRMILKKPEVSMVATKNGTHIKVIAKNFETEFQWVKANCPGYDYAIGFPKTAQVSCPDRIVSTIKGTLLSPYWVSLLTEYFRSPKAPQALVFAADGYSFAEGLGQHGGLTSDEVNIPLLSNSELNSDSIFDNSGFRKRPLLNSELLPHLLQSQIKANSPSQYLDESKNLQFHEKTQELEIESPLTFVDANHQDHAASWNFNLGLSLKWIHHWSAKWHSILSYGLFSLNDKDILEGSTIYQRFRFGAYYRFNHEWKLDFSIGSQEEPVFKTTGKGHWFWFNRAGFETQYKVLSFLLGSLYLDGGFGGILPAHDGSENFSTGFYQNAALRLENNADFTNDQSPDRIGIGFFLENQYQKSQYSLRSLLEKSLVFYYRIGL
jgi:hypothetical protein